MEKLGCIAGICLMIFFIGIIIFFTCTQSGVMMINNWKHGLKTVDGATRYETKKKVEDSCRSMIASYKTDKITYEQYKDSDNEEKQGWAEQAKMRANKTASAYNNFILKNEFVWKGNVPSDIFMKLEIIE